ncbi:MAG: Long-chain fatty acid transport protein [Deltaproteobacteria bacterium]|nr:Long-chain fatty acid transport protein [Deltaproteobacteria bacterium]
MKPSNMLNMLGFGKLGFGTLGFGLSAALATVAHAGGFAVTEQTAVSSGTGGAGVARADDPGAAWHDPAALADGGGWRFDLSLIVARPSLEARALDGSWAASTDAGWSTPPHLDLSYAHDRWAAGVSLGVPFGSGVTWPTTWPGRHEIVATELQVFRAAPFVAWSFGKLRVAAGAHADFGRLQIARDLDFIDLEGDVAIDMDGHGFGVDASAFYQARPELAFGAAYRGRTRLPVHGGANFTAPDAFSDKIADQAAQSELVLPDQLAVGGRYQRGSYAALAELELTMWSTTKQLVVDFAQTTTPDVMQDQRWHNTVALRAGGEWTRRKLTLRHGTYLEQSPAPADRLAPSSPDSTRLGLSAGASWRFDRTWSVDGFVESMWLLRRDTTDMDSLQASYGGHAMLAGLGLRWTP